MAIEHITIEGVEAKQGNRGTFYMVKYAEGGKNKLFCFDPKASADLLTSIGKTVAVDVDRTPNAQGDVYPKILTFHGEAVGAAPAAPTSPSTPSATVATAAQPARGGEAMKKDPVGIILGSRQTALNAAVARCGDNAPPEKIVAVAQQFNEFLLAGLSPFILRDGIHVANAMPWKKDARKAETEAARAKLPEPEPAPQPQIPDDEIPF